jgi:hypothetical protein
MRLSIPLVLLALASCGDLEGVGPNGDTDTSDATCESGCDVIPEDFCDDDFNAVRYVGEGECVDGGCAWPIATETCDFDCSQGRCIAADPCEEVLCEELPAPVCADANTRRTFEDWGVCNDTTATLINVDGGLHTPGMPNSAAAFLVVTSYNVVSQRRP